MPEAPDAVRASASKSPGSSLEGLELDLRTFGVHAIVTTRSGGVSVGPYSSLNLGDHVGDDPSWVAENRSRLAVAMGVPRDALMIANQVHGSRAATIARGVEPREADALVTSDPTIALCVLVADCVPAVLVDPDAQVLAVVHAGWRGITGQTARAAIDSMARLGADPARCHVRLGPCISPRAYQVGPEVAAGFQVAGCEADVRGDVGDRFRVDLAGAFVRQVVACGVPTTQVSRSSFVTDGGDRFFSDRAQRPCGRFAIAARLSGDAS